MNSSKPVVRDTHSNVKQNPGTNFFKREWKHFNKNRELFFIIFPGALKILIFSYLPMIGIILAFKDYRYDKGIFGSSWVGLSNFKFFFLSDTAWRVTRNTVLYEFGYIILTTIFALAFAVMLNEISRKFTKFYQTALFLPHFLSWVVVFYIVFAFLDINNGMLNKLLVYLGFEEVNWYLSAGPWPFILNVVALWKRVGYSALVYYAAIMALNQEYYEAARMDGASRWHMATKITVPLITPLISILIILSIGSLFTGDFGLHFFIPNNSGMTYPTTDIIDTYIYRALLTIGDVGMSAAIGLFQSVVGLILVVTANYVVKKLNSENSLW
ncbi:ABC transporter permease subunit [Paenibacillus sp. LMG 31461]|uniref:ABC transporter permease subunit n=1 Tax=Paenibacillus plantarum TaxID=2654975 RepID=A0ABX1X8J1_9BACL|nr:ABC transporter permease subunit [Paenibacillus plantarum]NOU64637.1 ABC transporter permease subunit [Paenibacillus plantarum]